MHKIGIVIVSYNVKYLLEKCVSNLYSYVAKNEIIIIVVDNNSQDGSYEFIKTKFPLIKIIKNEKNIGFSKAANLGIRYIFKNCATMNFLCLLNPDTIVGYNKLNEMLFFLNSDDKIGGVAPVMKSPLRKDKNIWVGGYIPTLKTSFNYFLFLSKIFPKNFKGIFLDRKSIDNKNSPIKLEWLSCACLLIKKQVFLDVGLLNEDYFLYGEDVELGCRIAKKGWELFLMPEIEIIHLERQSSEKAANKDVLWLKGFFQFVKTNQSKYYQLICLTACIGFFIRFLIYRVLYMTHKDDYLKYKYKQLHTYFKYCISIRNF